MTDDMKIGRITFGPAGPDGMPESVRVTGTVKSGVERRIVCAAVRFPGGTIACGPRHYDAVMRGQMVAMGIVGGPHHGEHGFVDQRGEFLTREQAWEIAHAAGQIIRRCGGDDRRLYSENLY